MFTYTNWLAPVYKLQESMNEGVRMMSACQMTNFSKQLAIRTSSWSGVMDMVFTLGGNVAKYFTYTSNGKYTDPLMYTDATMMQYRAPMVDAALDLVNAKTCARQSRALGTLLSTLLNVQSPDAVYFADLTFQLTNKNQLS